MDYLPHENVGNQIIHKANPLKLWKMMGRMHADKYLIADGKNYILEEEIHIIISKDFQDTRTMTDVLVICDELCERKFSQPVVRLF